MSDDDVDTYRVDVAAFTAFHETHASGNAEAATARGWVVYRAAGVN